MGSEPDAKGNVEPAAVPKGSADDRRPTTAQPEQSLDDTDAGWGERPDEDGHDRWLREQRPPHWE